jgi:hypothetical protein
VVHDAAVPAFVDVARCIAVGAVVLAKGQRRGGDAKECQYEEYVSHILIFN